jgi:ATPase subunit of ABC transporter with duplicated ATPase domains
MTTKKVKVLSGGEKTRLAMIKLLLEPVNLILDEPSNHLDMKTKDIIKDALRDFDGTLILVSHDRDFLDGLATKVLNSETKGSWSILKISLILGKQENGKHERDREISIARRRIKKQRHNFYAFAFKNRVFKLPLKHFFF